MKRFLKFVLIFSSVCLGAYVVGLLTLARFLSLDDFFNAGVFGRAWELFLSVLGILAVYHFTRISVGGKGRSDIRCLSYLAVVGVAIVIAILLSRSGSGTGLVNCDPLRGGDCEVVEDEPVRPRTENEKLREAMLLFLGIAIPGLIGVRKGLNDAQKSEVKMEAADINYEG